MSNKITKTVSTAAAANKAVEQLETRTMMSVSVVVDATKTMHIQGGSAADSLHVEFTSANVKVYDIHAKSFGHGAPLLGTWSLTGVKYFSVEGNGGNDVLEVGGYVGKPLTINGGAGNDILIGSEYAESILGGAGDDNIFGRGGDDFLFGEAGDDTLVGDGPNSAIGKDFISGGAGTDLVSYWYATAATTIDLNKTAVSGVAGEHDTLWNDIEKAVGSAHADTITGNALSNVLWGGAGNDKINGMGGQDMIYGEAGNDTLTGGQGSDVLVGGLGSDELYASDDADLDVVWGGAYGVTSDNSNEFDEAYLGKNANNQWDVVGGEVEQTWNVP